MAESRDQSEGELPTLSMPAVDDPQESAAMHVRLFGSTAFFRLWLTQVVSATGDWLGFGAMHGTPIVEFDCTILVNTSPQKSPRTLPEPREAKVTTPVAKPPAPPGPVASGQARYSTSRTPDALRNGQSSSFDDYELSTDWARLSRI